MADTNIILLKRKYILFILLAVAYYVFIVTFRFHVSENFILYPGTYRVDETCIIVHGIDADGIVRVVEGAGFLAAAVEPANTDHLNVTEVLMSGKQISDHLDYPDYYACDFLVKGTVTGVTSQYTETRSGVIPVFEGVEVYPLMSIAGFPQFLSAKHHFLNFQTHSGKGLWKKIKISSKMPF